MSIRKQWIIDQAEGLHGLEFRLNSLDDEGAEVIEVLAVSSPAAAPRFVIVAYLRVEGREQLPAGAGLSGRQR